MTPLTDTANLIAIVELMLAESGDPAIAKHFDVAEWIEEWIHTPNPALGGVPADLLSTDEGRRTVSELLRMMQSGAYG
jgi:uncharacterized protein (DUF2384 family)